MKLWLNRPFHAARLELAALALVVLFGMHGDNQTLARAEGDSTVAPLMRLLKSNRVPQERLGNIVELICKRGNAEDLGYVYEQLLSAKAFQGDLRRQTLDFLADAALTRKVRPDGDLSALKQFVGDSKAAGDEATRLAAVRLGGLWKVQPLVDPFQKIALDAKSDPALRKAAVEGIVQIGGKPALDTVLRLTTADNPQQIRYLAVAALAALDLEKAAAAAPAVLRDAAETDDPAAMMAAFLDRKGGVEKLAAALTGQELPVDAAKLALRYMYSVGRSDAVLSDALAAAAGIGTEAKPLSDEEIKQLSAEVLAKGDPHRGEAIFRRTDLSCMKCHAISKAGGGVGPDLSAVGSSSPVDYVVRSILFPDQSIKEQYKTIVVVTAEGKVFTGIPVDRNDDRLILKLADGKQQVIPADDIDEEGEGQSLMPKGLTRFLTHAELLDLSRFLAELGKPGAFGIRATPTIQRWRALKPVSQDLAAAVPDPVNFQLKVLDADAGHWLPAYARVDGSLPLDELQRAVGSDVLYAYGEVDVGTAGEIGVRRNTADGAQLWIDDRPQQSAESITAEVSQGRQRIVVRIDMRLRKSNDLRVELFHVKGSPAEFNVVDGQ